MWKHVIIDDFLSKEHFDYINNAFESKVMTLVDESRLEIHSEDESVSHKITKELVREMYDAYIPRLLEVLKELSPEKVEQYNHARINFVVVPKDYMFPMHTDSENKLLSVVVYLKPEKNAGTILYENKDGANPIRVKWKQNRAFIFSRTNETWHAFHGDGINPRYTLVISLTHKKEFSGIKKMTEENKKEIAKKYKAMRPGEWEKRLEKTINAMTKNN